MAQQTDEGTLDRPTNDTEALSELLDWINSFTQEDIDRRFPVADATCSSCGARRPCRYSRNLHEYDYCAECFDDILVALVAVLHRHWKIVEICEQKIINRASGNSTSTIARTYA